MYEYFLESLGNYVLFIIRNRFLIRDDLIKSIFVNINENNLIFGRVEREIFLLRREKKISVL